MSEWIKFDYGSAAGFIHPSQLSAMEKEISAAHHILHEKKGRGGEFTGWLHLPQQVDRDELARIERTARHIRNTSDAFVVIGVGGSYLGARAVIELLSHTFHNELSDASRNGPRIYFVGHHVSPDYMQDLLEILKDQDVSVNVISKSGTTTEPAVAFRIMRQFLQEKYGVAEARKRIYVTTDRSRGALKKMADEEGYTQFVIPDDIGGRYSVLTPVGLLPIAVAGIDIEALLTGAAEAAQRYAIPDWTQNACYQYAAVRQHLYRSGKKIELLVHYEPCIHYFAEWWKQLYGESEGKEGKGLFPAAVQFTTDLHSLGQFIQEGERLMFETILQFDNPQRDMVIPAEEKNEDGLKYLAGQTMDHVNKKAMEGTLLAHTDGGVPGLLITVPKRTPFHIGGLIYFFEKACAISGYMMGVNPFDQPGVESYKKNMFALLGKPGYEQEKQVLLQRLNCFNQRS